MNKHLHRLALLSIVICPLSIALPGCAVPHRKAASTHVIEVFQDRADGLVSRESWKDSEGGVRESCYRRGHGGGGYGGAGRALGRGNYRSVQTDDLPRSMMTNRQIEQQERAAENRLGRQCLVWGIVAAAIGIVGKQNHTLRIHCRQLIRLTNAFSKKFENFEAAVALNFVYYSFCKIHGAIRCTPAMEAGVEKSQWTVADLLKNCGK
jgi:hypothetical protein